MKKTLVKPKADEYFVSFLIKFIRIMKISVLLLFMGFVTVFASETYSQKTKLTLAMNNATVEHVLNKIETQSEFYFLYSHQLVDVSRKVDVDVKNVRIKDILTRLFTGTDVKYLVLGRQIILTPEHILTDKNVINIELQQGIVVTGKVVENNGNPLPGVNVYEKSSPSRGVVSSVDGTYSITVSNADAVLVYSFVGFENQEIDVLSRTVIDVTLIESSIILNEVVTVGYGTQRKVNLTGAVENVAIKDLESRPLTTTSAALQGKVAGVYVTQNSGQPGYDNATIKIRGVGTLNNNNPLVLIDGIPGSMNDVNPMDLEDISVLKDAAASAIYGNRAANGVILITTKRGKQGKMQVEYSGYFAVQKATYLPEILNSYEHAMLYNEAATNSGGSPKYTDDEVAKFKAKNDPLYPDTDWQDVMFAPANMQNHHLRTSGSSENLSYAFSAGYLNQDGVLMGSGYKKFTFRSNIDSYYLKNKRLHVGINMAGVRSSRDESPRGTTAVIRAINRADPTKVVTYEDGTYGSGAREIATIQSGGNNNLLNNSFTGKLFADYEIMKGLKAQLSYGVDWYHGLATRYYPSLSLYNHLNDTHTTYLSELRESNSEAFSTIFNALLNYEVSFVDKHNFKVLAGYSEETWRRDWSNGFRKNLLSSQPELNIGDVSTQTNAGGADATALRSYFARVNYDLSGKYLLEANIRYDGSSRFAEELRYGTFPSFSAGWRISEEQFMQNATFLDNLKIRASWGQLGNQNINTYYAASDILATGADYTFNGNFVPGVAVTTLTNKSTTWETTTQTNIGLDVNLWRKFSLTANYFQKITEDILMTVPIPITLGALNRPYQNIGTMENTGWELSLGYNNTFGNSFRFNANLNLSHVNNEVTNLNNLGPIYGSKTILTEGEAYWSFYGYEHVGIFQSDQEISTSPTQSENPVPGDIKFKDQDGDGIISLDKDRVVIGSQVPDLLYSIQLNGDWKGFDLKAFFQGVQGVDAYSSLELVSPFFNGASSGKWLLDRWTPENPSTTNQRVFLDTKRPGIVSTYYLEDASYLRLKNIELGYTIPQSATSKIGLSYLRVFANIQNAFTITNYKGFDPEKPAGNTRSDAHPQVRITSLGLSVRF